MPESVRLRSVQAPIIPVIADLIRGTPGTISLGQGVVGYGPPPEAQARLASFFAEPANHKYQPVIGLPALVEAWSTQLREDYGLNIGAAAGTRLVVTAGGNNAFLAALLAIADPGDEVILPTPFYFNHEMAVTMANCRPVLVLTDSAYQVDPDALARAITPRTRAIVTVSPNNPTGAVYPEATLRAVNALCAKHGLYHLSDEAYSHFTYDGAAHFSPGTAPGAAGHTISVHSLSKSHGFASWRIGALVIPAHLESAVRKIQDTFLICPPVVSQFAAVGALSAGTNWVRDRVRTIAPVRTQVQRALQPLVSDGLCTVPHADGAFYFLLRISTAESSMALAERLIRGHRVATIPGVAFGLSEGCYLRVAYAALEPTTVAEGIGRLVTGLRAIVASGLH